MEKYAGLKSRHEQKIKELMMEIPQTRTKISQMELVTETKKRENQQLEAGTIASMVIHETKPEDPKSIMKETEVLVIHETNPYPKSIMKETEVVKVTCC